MNSLADGKGIQNDLAKRIDRSRKMDKMGTTIVTGKERKIKRQNRVTT